MRKGHKSGQKIITYQELALGRTGELISFYLCFLLQGQLVLSEKRRNVSSCKTQTIYCLLVLCYRTLSSPFLEKHITPECPGLKFPSPSELDFCFYICESSTVHLGKLCRVSRTRFKAISLRDSGEIRMVFLEMSEVLWDALVFVKTHRFC